MFAAVRIFQKISQTNWLDTVKVHYVST